jgi:flavin reductase (DIM6/NTAB) family NADH-FMN oxidoreductase RutF
MSRRSLGPRTLLYPTPVLLVGTYDAAGRPNIMTAAWGGICCSRPPCIYVSLRAATYTHGLIVTGGCYTVSIPSANLIREADYAGIVSGRDVNKFQVLGLTHLPGTHVHAPYVGECPVVIECRLVNTVELGSHTQFVGEVLDVHADEAVLAADGMPDIALVQPTLFDPAGRGYYGVGAALGEAFSVGRRDNR